MTTSARCARLVLCLALLLPLCAPRLGRAEDREAFKAHYKRAKVLFNSAQYDKAIPEFQAAYEADPRPILLFNLAQASRLGGHPKEAQALYERFLRLQPETELRAEIEGYLAEIKEQTEPAPRPAPEASAPAATPAPAEPVARPAPPPAPAPVPLAEATSPVLRRARPMGVAGWVLAGAGLLAIGAGAGLIAVDGRPGCALEPGQRLCPTVLRSLVPGIVALAGGGALLGVGVPLIAVDYRRSARDGSHVAMLTLGAAF